MLWTRIVSQKIKNQIAVLANYHLDKDEVQSELDQLEIKFNGKKTLLTNAITIYVRECLKFLSGESKKLPEMEMSLTNEVPNNALNDNV